MRWLLRLCLVAAKAASFGTRFVGAAETEKVEQHPGLDDRRRVGPAARLKRGDRPAELYRLRAGLRGHQAANL